MIFFHLHIPAVFHVVQCLKYTVSLNDIMSDIGIYLKCKENKIDISQNTDIGIVNTVCIQFSY